MANENCEMWHFKEPKCPNHFKNCNDTCLSKKPMFPIKGVRTDCHTKETKEVDLQATIRNTNWIWIVGGPTGYESIQITEKLKTDKRDWTACMGDVGYNYPRYDRLVIKNSELEKILVHFQFKDRQLTCPHCGYTGDAGNYHVGTLEDQVVYCPQCSGELEDTELDTADFADNTDSEEQE